MSLFAAAPASATIIYADVNTVNYLDGNLIGDFTVGNFSGSGPAGRFLFNGTNVDTNALFTALTFCVDIFTPVNTSNYLLGGAPDLFSGQLKQNQLAALLANADTAIASSMDRNATAAALQLAIWELIYEQGTGTYSVGGGNFATSGFFTTLHGEANGYLANVENMTWTGDVSRVGVLRSELAQSQTFYGAAAAVPEPATWAMMLVGFGVVGAAMRRRRPTLRASFG